MNLSHEEATRYWDLMYPLQFFVNQQLQLLSEITTVDTLRKYPTEEKAIIRDALWDNPHLIDLYLAKNPFHVDEEGLTIIEQWHQHKRGMFFVERLLKKHAIFINDEKVFGVLGIHNSIKELIPRSYLPAPINTVLIPFQGKIIYDGLFSFYNIFVGGGIKASLKEAYLRAKREGKITVSFDQAIQAAASKKNKVVLKDWNPLLDQLLIDTKPLRAQSASPPTWSPAFSLVKASLRLAKAAIDNPNDTDKLWNEYTKLANLMNKMEQGISRSYD